MIRKEAKPKLNFSNEQGGWKEDVNIYKTVEISVKDRRRIAACPFKVVC